jgi:hypothetical protein
MLKVNKPVPAKEAARNAGLKAGAYIAICPFDVGSP